MKRNRASLTKLVISQEIAVNIEIKLILLSFINQSVYYLLITIYYNIIIYQQLYLHCVNLASLSTTYEHFVKEE